MEAWGDEWWIPMAMHTRWTYPENYALFEREAGSALLPSCRASLNGAQSRSWPGNFAACCIRWAFGPGNSR
ncbi:MAG: hypothetical protein IPG16_19255 [Comamonadaceae bacterium]|nr:hypothetical protein [Comamonadaceae bacterium]